MKNFTRLCMLAAALAFLHLAAALTPSDAQTVTQQPKFIVPNTIQDLGNGPMELQTVVGNAWAFTSQGAGTGSTSGSSTALTLTTTPANPPCVGCVITGVVNPNGSNPIATGTTVINYNGTTTVGLSSAQTIPAGTSIVWGSACPAFSGGLPAPNVPLQPGTGVSALPLYTQSRVCAYAANGPGATVLPFAIGAH